MGSMGVCLPILMMIGYKKGVIMGSKLSDVISKVQKLLNVAASSDKPGEVEAAQSLAQELITKYQIEEAQLNGHLGEGDIIRKRVDMPKPYTIDKSVLLNAIAKYNFCKVLRGEGYCYIYGYKSDVKLCIALYDLLSVDMVSQMTFKLNKLKEQSVEKFNSKPWVKSFFGGYAISISLRIKDSKSRVIKEVEYETGTSLELVVTDKQYAIEEYFQKLDRKKSADRSLSSPSGYQAGVESGRDANLNQSSIER